MTFDVVVRWYRDGFGRPVIVDQPGRPGIEMREAKLRRPEPGKRMEKAVKER